MRKICKNSECNYILFDATPDDLMCPECGHLLYDEASVGNQSQMHHDAMPQRLKMSNSGVPQHSSIPQMDNSIHSGDNIGEIHNGNEMHVGGDNAESIDKSTTINNTTNTTSNTTNYTVYQPKDEGREMMVCEYSGTSVYLCNTFKCKKCSRRIDKKFYIEEYNCCKECSEKEITERKNVETQIPHKLPTSLSTATVATSPAATTSNIHDTAVTHIKPVFTDISINPEASNIPYSDISKYSNTNEKNGNKWKYAVAISLFVVISCAGYFAFNNNRTSNNPAPQEDLTSKTQTANETGGATITQSISNGSNVAIEKTVTVSETETPKPVDNMAEGEAAYNRKEYGRAKVLLQTAANEGKAAANYYLALMYGNGMGVSADIRKSFTYMHKAAEGGEKRAYFPLAEMYRDGNGTEANRAQAKKWFEQVVVHDRSHAEEASEYLEIYE